MHAPDICYPWYSPDLGLRIIMGPDSCGVPGGKTDVRA